MGSPDLIAPEGTRAGAASGPVPHRTRRRPRSNRRTVAVLAVIALVFGGMVLNFGVTAPALTRPQGPENTPLLGCGSASIGCDNADSATVASAITPDLTVTSSNTTNFAGSPTPFQAALPFGFTATGYTWWWGDGSVSTTSTGTTSHTYSSAGVYLVYAQATDSSGLLHDNLRAILRHVEVSSATGDALGNYPEVAGAIVANSSTNVNATATIPAGGAVTVENWIASGPSNPDWSLGTPDYFLSANAGPYATPSSSILNSSGIDGVTVSFSPTTPNGSYALSFSAPSLGKVNGTSATVWANFTFTVFVSSGAVTPLPSIPTSPHPGSLAVYYQSTFSTWDSQLVYDSIDGGILQNVVQSLLFRNVSHDGSSPQDLVPDLATCVPGSVQCFDLYGNYLEDAQGDYTFGTEPQRDLLQSDDRRSRDGVPQRRSVLDHSGLPPFEFSYGNPGLQRRVRPVPVSTSGTFLLVESIKPELGRRGSLSVQQHTGEHPLRNRGEQ